MYTRFQNLGGAGIGCHQGKTEIFLGWMKYRSAMPSMKTILIIVQSPYI